MFRRNSDGIAVSASIRMNDGAILIGTINCGMSGRLDNLLTSDSSFIEFVSKDGQQRFLARHQVSSIEPLASIAEPALPEVDDTMDPYLVLGVKLEDSLEQTMAAFQYQLQLYNPERWSGKDMPFEFSRYAAEKTRQINMAFTIVRGALHVRAAERKLKTARSPLFGKVQLQA